MEASEHNERLASQSLQYCSYCKTVMLLTQVTPALWAVPEVESFRCPRCGNVITWDIDVGSVPH
jgi:predicted RNA-binding Zn-ribbon protein involved in translation (DUF1610 family)